MMDEGGMNMKRVIKFKFEEKEGYLSVVEKGNLYYSLVQKDTPKVKDIQKSHQLLVSYDLKQPVYVFKPARIVEDPKLTQWVYETLEKENNVYFKTLDDSLCVVEIPKE